MSKFNKDFKTYVWLGIAYVAGMMTLFILLFS